MTHVWVVITGGYDGTYVFEDGDQAQIFANAQGEACSISEEVIITKENGVEFLEVELHNEDEEPSDCTVCSRTLPRTMMDFDLIDGALCPDCAKAQKAYDRHQQAIDEGRA